MRVVNRREICSEVEERALRFLRSISKKDEVIVVFHNDGDGICSCALMKHFLKTHAGIDAHIISQPMPPKRTLSQRIKLSLPTKIIFLDLGIDQKKKIIKNLEMDCEILIIDHHEISCNLNSKRTVHYNPLFCSRVYQAASYLVYKLCSRIIDMKERMWVALIGIISDYNIEDVREFINRAAKRYSNIIKPNPSREELFNSEFGRATEMINAAKAARISCEEIVRIIESVRTLRELLENEELARAYERVQNEIERVFVEVRSKALSSRKIILYELQSKLGIRSQISTKLSTEFPDKIILVYERSRNKIKISARTQLNVNLISLMKDVLSDVHATFGGHEHACGIEIKREDFDYFKQKLLEIESRI